jgi:hypothetical protein
MEKSDSYAERIEAVSASSPAMSNAEKQHHNDAIDANRELDESSLPPGYFTSKFFLGTMAGIGLGLMAGVAAFGYAAPILNHINADIGPVSPSCPSLRVELRYTITSYITPSTSNLSSHTHSSPET